MTQYKPRHDFSAPPPDVVIIVSLSFERRVFYSAKAFAAGAVNGYASPDTSIACYTLDGRSADITKRVHAIVAGLPARPEFPEPPNQTYPLTDAELAERHEFDRAKVKPAERVNRQTVRDAVEKIIAELLGGASQPDASVDQ